MPIGKYTRKTITVIDRLMAMVEIHSNGCWLWTGALTAGYGMIGIGVRGDGSRRIVRAHRVSYEIHIGPIPDGMQLDHTCHKKGECMEVGSACLHRRCVNPYHLEPVTSNENKKRGNGGLAGAEKQRSKTTCPWGHAYSKENTGVRRGRRICRACARDRERNKRLGRKAAFA